MTDEQRWYEEAVKSNVTVFTTNKDQDFLIYKGVKIARNGEEYEAFDVRVSDYYSSVSDDVRAKLNHMGFIKGSDQISHRRNINRVLNLTCGIKSLEEKKSRYEEKLKSISNETHPVEYSQCLKKIKSSEDSIDKMVVERAVYQNRINQYLKQ